MPEPKPMSTEETAEQALFLIRNFTKTQLALALSVAHKKMRRPFPLASMKEWESLGPYELLSIAKQKNGVANGE